MEAAFTKKDKDEVLRRLNECAHTLELDCEDALHRACAYGWLDVAGVIISRYGVDPDVTESWGSRPRPIHVAAKEGQTEAIDFLLLAGADKKAEDAHGNTALHCAFERSQWDTAEYLMVTAHCDPGKKNMDGVAPLVIGLENATGLDSPDTLRRIVQTYASLKDSSAVTIPYWLLEKVWKKQWKEEIVRLSKAESAKELKDGGYVPLPVTIASAGNMELLEFLISEGEIDLSTVDTNGNNALLSALQNGHTEVAKMIIKMAPNLVAVKNLKGESPVRFATHNKLLDILMCLVENGARPDEPDDKGSTPLSSAIRDKNQVMVEYLVKDLKCNLGHKNKDGGTPFADGLTSALYENDSEFCIWLLNLTLATNERAKAAAMVPQNALNLACKNRMVGVVETLVQWYNCDPALSVQSIGGQSVLHKVFERQDIEIASVLLAHKPCRPTLSFKNGPTLLELAEGSDKLTSLLLQCNVSFVCQARKPMKIFVLGNPSNGKTSLVKILKGSMNHEPLLGSLRTVRPKHRTTGISAYKILHRDIGSIVLYDCAGRPQYRSTVTAMIEKLVKCSPAVFVIVVDINQKKEEIVKELLYWTYFLNCVTARSPGQSHVIIAGSNADNSAMNPWGFQNCCTSWINEDLNDLVFGGGVMIDCRKLQSRGLSDLTALLSQSCATIRSKNPFGSIGFQHLSLYALCMEEMATNFAVAELRRTLMGKHEREAYFLPHDDEVLSSLELLHNKGLLVYLEKEGDKDGGFVIADLAFLFRRTVGQLFASSSEKQYFPLNVNNGVIPLDHFQQLRCDPEILFLFLHKFNLGMGIHQHNADPAFFVPGLVTKESLEVNNLATRNDGYWFGMLSEFKQEHSHLHFIDHFLHILQLEVTEHFLEPNIAKGDTSSAGKGTAFDFWKNGIWWRDNNQVECLIEISEDRKMFLLLMACSPRKEIHLVVCRSKLFKIIHEVRERFFKQISSNIVDYVVPGPDLQQYPNINTANMCRALLSDVRQSVLKRESPVEFTAQAVIGKHSTKVSLDMRLHDLLYFDSLLDISLKSLVNLLELHASESQCEELPAVSLLKEFAIVFIKMAGANCEILNMIGLKHDEIAYVFSNETGLNEPPAVSDRLVEKWVASGVTPSQLKSMVEHFTMFGPVDSLLN